MNKIHALLLALAVSCSSVFADDEKPQYRKYLKPLVTSQPGVIDSFYVNDFCPPIGGAQNLASIQVNFTKDFGPEKFPGAELDFQDTTQAPLLASTYEKGGLVHLEFPLQMMMPMLHFLETNVPKGAAQMYFDYTPNEPDVKKQITNVQLMTTGIHGVNTVNSTPDPNKAAKP